MKRLLGLVCAVLFLAGAAEAQMDSQYSRKNTFGVFVNYSNNSSHIIIGQERNRKIAGIGAAYSRRLAHKASFDFTYEAEVRPVTFLRDPVVTGTSTFTIQGFPTVIDAPVGTVPFSGPTTANCTSGTTVFNGTSPNKVVYTETTTQTCGSRWSYTGGISPLGLRFQFLKRYRVQPFLVANGGFLAAFHDEPVNNSESFNFTFEVGGGVEWFRNHQRSVAVDYRMHHLSNGYRGFYNPGIDSGVFRVSYRFGR
jgi:hypothetical protein